MDRRRGYEVQTQPASSEEFGLIYFTVREVVAFRIAASDNRAPRTQSIIRFVIGYAQLTTLAIKPLLFHLNIKQLLP